MAEKNDLMDKVISLCKRRGFVYQSSEIYGGFAGFWDYGPMGTLLKENVKALWLKMFRDSREDMYGLDAAIIMNPHVWEASGHVKGFNDPMVECTNCHGRFRADYLYADFLDGISSQPLADEFLNSPESKNIKSNKLKGLNIKCPNCGKTGTMGEPKQFNMMFKTHIGATEDEASVSYLRPETAQGIFVNFKNVLDSMHPKLPFGIAQIGKAFRNEISPRDFTFRSREFEQMEVEYFVKENDWEKYFQMWTEIMRAFGRDLGISQIIEVQVPDGDRAHYSKRTTDFEFNYPFGQKELWGLAYRTDYDLKAHGLEYFDEGTGEKLIPHVIEPSLGVDRTILALLVSAYAEDEQNGEVRIYLKLPKAVAPIKAAVFPLLKNKPELVAKAKEVLEMLREEVHPWIAWDDNGNIGKRYRRQDEIGTPYCITIDFDTLGENPDLLDTVTLRDRDTGEQERVSIPDLIAKIKA